MTPKLAYKATTISLSSWAMHIVRNPETGTGEAAILFQNICGLLGVHRLHCRLEHRGGRLSFQDSLFVYIHMAGTASEGWDGRCQDCQAEILQGPF